MKKTAFSKRLLSIATASMLLVSACSTLFTVSAETATDTETSIQTYQLLDTENYQAGWNTDGVAQNNLMTDIVSGKNLNRVSANYDTTGEVRVYVDCKTPEEADFSLADIHSVAYYFKNDAGRELTVNFQNFTDKNTDNGWLTAFGRIMSCTVYLVPSDADTVNATVSDGDGLVTIPEGFEGYVVYDTDTRTTESSSDIGYDLLTGEYTFGSAMAFTLPDGILKGGDVFYYGEISASTGTAKDFIATVKSDALYKYQLTSDVTWALDNISTSYDVKLDDLITTGTVSNFAEKNEFHFKTTSLEDLGGDVADISVISFYIKNSAGRGTLNISFGDMNVWEWLYYGDVSLYDINTETLTTIHINVDLQKYIAIPSGFEGYVFFDPKQSTDSDFNQKYASILNGKNITFNQPNSQTLIGNTISFGSITAWSGDYSRVKQTLINKSNTLSAPMSWGYDSSDVLKSTEVRGVSPDGACRKYEKLGTAGWKAMHFNLSNTQLGSYAVSSEYVSGKEALAVWFKNSSANSMAIGMFEEGGNHETYHWYTIAPSYRLFDTSIQSITDLKSGTISIPAGFEGYIFILLDSTNVTKDDVTKTWKQFVADGDTLTSPAFNANTDDLEVGDCYYIGNLAYVKSIDEFIESRLEVTLDGDANKDGSADILDLVRLKKNAAGVEGATVYVPNVSYGGNNDTAAATTVSNLRKQLLGAEYEKAAVSKEVHDRLVPPAEHETDTVTAANSQVGVSIYHLTAGDWDKVYSDEKAESEFINYYPGNDISDVRTAKERGAAAWIGINSSYFNDVTGYENLRANLDKYVETLKAEKLWNTVAGFEFEEITQATETDAGLLEQFKELSEYLYKTYPEKRQFAVLSLYEVSHATPDAYKYVSDIAFDWYNPTEIETMREKFELMMTNTGLANAKYWFMPGVYTDEEPSAATADHALAQINVCYELLMEQPVSNRGGIYFYNWQTYTDDDGNKAYGLDQLLNNEYYADVKARIFEVSASLDGTPEFIEIHKGRECNSSENWFDLSDDFKAIDKTNLNINSLSYYIKNTGSSNINGFLWFNQAWYHISPASGKIMAYTYNLNDGSVTTIDIWSGYFNLPVGFEGYVCYDIANCTIEVNKEVKSAREVFQANIIEQLLYTSNTAIIKDISFSTESFETVDAYFKSLIKNIVVNDGTDGNTGWVWTEYNNGTASNSRNYTTVDGVSPDGTALKLSYTGEEIATISNAGWAEGGINTSFTANRDLLSSATMLSYYVKLDNGENFNIKFGIRSYKTINAPVTVYDLKTKELTTYPAGTNLDFTEFEGYVMFDLRSASVDWTETVDDVEVPYSYSWTDYAANNDITGFQLDLSANSLVNRSLVIDSVTFSTDYYAQLNAIMAK